MSIARSPTAPASTPTREGAIADANARDRAIAATDLPEITCPETCP